MIGDFVFIDETVPEVRWDAKYATWDNFTAKPVDGYVANRIVGTTALCAALTLAQAAAAERGLGLLLWDGYRPQRAVENFLRWAEQPEDGRMKQRHYPSIERAQMFDLGYVAAQSAHPRGSTVDLTLFSRTTDELAPMGGGHDLMDVRSHHGAASVTPEQAFHRRWLREIMEMSGFAAYEKEWWHYTLTDEPYPDTYFDFPIESMTP